MSEENRTLAERQRPHRLLWGIIVRPRATLEHAVQERRSWWLPALLTMLMVILPIVAAGPIRARQTREAVLATQERLGETWGANEGQAQMEEAMSVAASPLITTIFPSVGSALSLGLGWLVWAGALYLANLALGGRAAFGPTLRMVIWTWIPYAFRGLLQALYVMVTGQLIANPGLSGLVADNRPVSEAVLAPPSAGQMVLRALLSRFDLFLVWNLALLVMGTMAVARLPRRRAILITLGVWAILTAVGLLPALIGGLFAQQAVLGGP